MSTALIVNAIRNMFRHRKPKPKPARPSDGEMGPRTRVVIAKYAATPDMPTPPPAGFWDVHTNGRGTFHVELVMMRIEGPVAVATMTALMEELSPEMIIAMAHAIKRDMESGRQ